jgi:hypothetical protein
MTIRRQAPSLANPADLQPGLLLALSLLLPAGRCGAAG